MAPNAATANLAGVWMRRWDTATESGAREVLRFLRWQSAHPERLATVLAGLAPPEQVRSLASPLVVRARHSANGGDGTEADAHLDAIALDVRQLWERGNEATASDGNAGRTRARAKRGTSTPRGPSLRLGASDNGLRGEA